MRAPWFGLESGRNVIGSVASGAHRDKETLRLFRKMRISGALVRGDG